MCNKLNVVIMLSPLISRMLIYIFLLLRVILFFFMICLAKYTISGKFCLLRWPQPLGFSQPSLNLSCSFAIIRFPYCYLFSCLGPDTLLSGQARGNIHFCVHYYTLETTLPLGAFGLNTFNYPWKYQVSYVFPALVPPVLPKFLGEHVTG